jgi:hypothetical protein
MLLIVNLKWMDGIMPNTNGLQIGVTINMFLDVPENKLNLKLLEVVNALIMDLLVKLMKKNKKEKKKLKLEN